MPPFVLCSGSALKPGGLCFGKGFQAGLQTARIAVARGEAIPERYGERYDRNGRPRRGADVVGRPPSRPPSRPRRGADVVERQVQPPWPSPVPSRVPSPVPSFSGMFDTPVVSRRPSVVAPREDDPRSGRPVGDNMMMDFSMFEMTPPVSRPISRRSSVASPTGASRRSSVASAVAQSDWPGEYPRIDLGNGVVRYFDYESNDLYDDEGMYFFDLKYYYKIPMVRGGSIAVRPFPHPRIFLDRPFYYDERTGELLDDNNRVVDTLKNYTEKYKEKMRESERESDEFDRGIDEMMAMLRDI